MMAVAGDGTEQVFHIHLHIGGRTEQEEEILERVRDLQTKGINIMADLTSLQAQVEETKTVQQGAIALIEGLADRLDDVADDPAQVAALAAELRDTTAALADAVSVNTPDAPVGPDEPAPVEPTPEEPAPPVEPTPEEPVTP